MLEEVALHVSQPMASTVLHIVNGTLEWVTLALDAPSARAVVFGIHIGGHLFVEGLLPVVILFLLSQKSYKPPKRPLTKKVHVADSYFPKSRLSNIQGLSIASHPESPIVFFKLEKSIGSVKDDLKLLENIADRVFKEDSVFVVDSKRSTLDKCRLPIGIKLLVSVAHSESDMFKACESLKRVAEVVLNNYN